MTQRDLRFWKVCVTYTRPLSLSIEAAARSAAGGSGISVSEPEKYAASKRASPVNSSGSCERTREDGLTRRDPASVGITGNGTTQSVQLSLAGRRRTCSAAGRTARALPLLSPLGPSQYRLPRSQYLQSSASSERPYPRSRPMLRRCRFQCREGAPRSCSAIAPVD